VFGIHSVTNIWKIALSAAMGYGTAFVFALLWKLIAVPAALDQEKAVELAKEKKSAEDDQSAQVKELQEKARQLEDAARMEADRRKVNLSASLKTEPRSKPLIMRMSSQFSVAQSILVHVPEMSLVIYNHGEKAVRLRGYKLWKLAAVEASEEITLHDMVSPSTPAYVDVTEPLLRVVSGQAQHEFESLLGTCRIRLVVTYADDSKPVDSQPQDFQITCQRAGGAAIRILADEILV
jgi:hypothetical protein